MTIFATVRRGALLAAACLGLLPAWCSAEITVRGTTGQATVYAHVFNATTWLHYALTETPASSGVYVSAANSTINDTLTVDCRSTNFDSGFPVVVNNHATDQTAVFLDGPREGLFDWDGTDERLPASQDSVDDVAGDVGELEPGVAFPVSQVTVPPSRTWLITRTADGLGSETPIGGTVGETKPYALDFRGDLATNGKLVGFGSIVDYYADEDDEPDDPALTFGEELAVDKTQGKVTITPLVAGTYHLRVAVTYGPQDGGGSAIATVEFVASP